MKYAVRIVYLLLIAALLAACGAPAAGIGGSVIAKSDKPRNTSPGASQSDLEKLALGNTAFSFDLYKALRSTPGNLFLSPYSITTALAMAQAGMKGDSLQQTNQVLQFGLSDAALHQAINALQLALANREKNDKDASKNDFQLNVVNAAWGQAGYQFLPAYLDVLAQNYGAGMRLLDYKTDPEKARQVINDWVAEQTSQKIKDLIAEGLITPLTRLVLTNAIYFNAAWLKTFNEKATTNEIFTNLDGKQPSVPSMKQMESFNYFAGSGYQAVQLPYTANKLSMIVLVPDAGKFGEVEQQLSPALLDGVRKGLKNQTVRLSLPKFKVESSFGLGDTLKAMGMVDPFDPAKADFSGMDGTRTLFISSVVHKAFVNVDEQGTEAAAATAVIMSKTSMPVEIIDLKIDRPFIYLIQDNASGTILFMGRVTSL